MPRLCRIPALFVFLFFAIPESVSAPIEYRYDDLGRVVSVIYPSGAQVTYSYDAAGNRTSTVSQAQSGNRSPDAVDDTRSWLDGVGVLTFDPRTNDSDPDGQTLSVAGVGTSQYGQTSFTGTSVSYTAPNAHILEKDSFAYSIQDAAGARDSAVVTVDLGNLPPVAVNDSASTAPNTAVSISPLANDSDPGADPITITSVGTPSHGSVTLNGATVTYTPAAGYTGSDTFTYAISDGDGGTASAAVNVTIAGANSPPVAVGDSINVVRGTPYTFNPCSNDSDPNGDALTITAASQPSRGTRTWTGCSMTYTVTTGPAGTTSYTYTISDGKGGTATATINVTIDLPI